MKSIFKSTFFVGLVAMLIPSISFGQAIEVAISDGAFTDTDSCVEYLVLTDSNADGGNYEANESFETTLCFNTIEGDISQVQILPTDPATGSVWDVDDNSSLFIYEGTGTAGNLLGEFNSVSDPDGVFFTTTVNCLTFVFVSGATSSGEGFVAEFKCVQEQQPFNLEVVALAPTEFSTEEFDGLNPNDSVVTICYSDSISFQALLDFPLSDATGNGYEQTLATTNIIWDWGDGITEEGLGLDINGHIYLPFGGFLLTVIAEDEEGRRELARINVLVSPKLKFSGELFEDTLCIGDTTQLTGGILLQDTVGVDRNTGAINIYLDSTDSLALPDGSGTFYTTGINISNYADDPVITDAGDFVGICMNMEHSYLGDLEAWLTCPDGSTALLFDGFGGAGQYPNGENGFGGGGTFLGGAIDNDGTPDIMGEGFDYCFADDATPLGTMAAEFAAGNTVPASSGNAMIAGTYLPAEDFLTAFAGCPVNGPWELTIGDNIGSDNGFIFNWNIEFSSDFYIDTVYYSPTIVDAYWENNPDITTDNDTIITVSPSTPGNNSYTFYAEDSFGCIYDTTYNVYVRPMVTIDDAIACDLTHTLAPSNAVDPIWTILDKPSPTATVTGLNNPDNGATDDITVNEYGLYTFQIKEPDEYCGYEDTAVIDFRPDPTVAPLVSDTTLCVGASILLDAGPQENNSDNFSVLWTRDGGTIATDTYSIQADQTGVHAVTITGVCGTASDTSNIVAISIDFDGRASCGLQTESPVGVNVDPPGAGFWSSTTPGISFTNANQQVTTISSQTYGVIGITYTDNRCINDGVTEQFTFVQQPVVNVQPQHPEFCVDSDVLVITATVVGNNTGEYTWTSNGTPLGDTNDTLIFLPEYFNPNEGYIIEATARDLNFVCPEGTGFTNFTGYWCDYTIPNVVTPNDDGKNDRFHVENMEKIPDCQLRIYDRWGKEIFDHSDYGQYQVDNPGKNGMGGWDPTDAGTGTYFFELLIPTLDKAESGYFQVLDGDSKE